MDGKTGGLSPRTVKYLHSIMREALQHAFEQGIIYRNVADKRCEPPKGTRPQDQIWNATEARRFLTMAQDAPYAPLWLVLLTTGMRPGGSARIALAGRGHEEGRDPRPSDTR